MSEDCGAETTDGTPCKNDAESCPWHGENAHGEPRKTLLEENPSILELVSGELQNGATVPEACAEANISEKQYYDWRSRGREDDANDIFKEFRREATRARRIAARSDRDMLKSQCREQGDTRTWWKVHREQYGDLYAEASDESGTEEPIFAVPEELAKEWQQQPTPSQ